MTDSPIKVSSDLNESPSPKKRPQIQGIKGFYDSEQVEVQSPWRKKKTGLGKLALSVEATQKAESVTLKN